MHHTVHRFISYMLNISLDGHENLYNRLNR